jgi:hypothetical protein
MKIMLVMAGRWSKTSLNCQGLMNKWCGTVVLCLRTGEPELIRLSHLSVTHAPC